MQRTESQSPIMAHPEKRIPSAAVRKLCGDVSEMTLYRWQKNPALGFPRPAVIGRLKYWREADVLAWLNSREVAA